MQKRTWLMAAAMLASAAPATAQTIYPLTRAEILEGSRFDFKVEFPNAPTSADVKVTINGKPVAEAFGREVQFVQNEEGQKHSALWLRGAQLPAGQYVVEATQGSDKATVNWTVYPTAERKAKNVILFVGDGMSIAHRTAARILSKGWEQGLYGGELAIDDMPNMALISTSGTDSVVTDSANSASAYTTGHKSCVNALGIYCAKNALTLDHPKVETISEVIKRKRAGMAIGVVTNAEIEDATPAAMVAHTRRRSDYNDIVKMFFDVQPDVIMGGGSPNFLPKSTPGTKRTDDLDFIAKFKEAGYTLATTKTEMNAAVAGGSKKLLGLYNTSNIDGAFDLRLAKKGSISKFPDQPDVVEQTKAAIEMLKGAQDGFFLMVESARIDKYSHSLDWERAVFDTIMLDNAVKAAKEFAGDRNDTLIIVVPDHAHPISIIGTYDDDRPGQLLRDKLGTYHESLPPNYGPRDADGYPTKVDTSRRLAVAFGSYPDTCDTGRPYLDGERVPAVKGPDGKTNIANEKDCTGPLATRKQGNLPFDANSGVHAADDVLLTAMGPGSERFRGHKPNVFVFRVMAEALALGGK
ncbi:MULTISPECIES: alkaline phosphatase [unclassified Bosea (in: a-proteobacteria)]|uniref:alkaline phosphatase n=1 Tax=unclassified Bosea (in: a-proteobacteria) TaxID=2653178 RepID=UPI000F75717F|nr:MULTISPECIES: alkaline phosphatase [unclassified Bosea (in: a-proteobacteria)]AZO80900.1 alkaline phosphatase [Bosea sp. Tri-49]RXT25867.1 alkaline phosphatase [Bosea sp. Tri-39]RXT31109.1 alkaline phosphatase [Bosea sp. Tri-54]